MGEIRYRAHGRGRKWKCTKKIHRVGIMTSCRDHGWHAPAGERVEREREREREHQKRKQPETRERRDSQSCSGDWLSVALPGSKSPSVASDWRPPLSEEEDDDEAT